MSKLCRGKYLGSLKTMLNKDDKTALHFFQHKAGIKRSSFISLIETWKIKIRIMSTHTHIYIYIKINTYIYI